MVGRRLGLAVEPGVVRAAAVVRGRARWVASATWSNAGDLATAIAALAAEQPRGAWKVVAAIGGRALQFKMVQGLPSLEAGELRRHVALAAARYFVGARDHLAVDAAPLGGREAGGAAVLAAARADIADAIVAGTRAAGLELLDIVPGPLAMEAVLFGAAAETEPAFAMAVGAALSRRPLLSLLPLDAKRAGLARRARSVRRAAIAIAATLAVAAITHVAYLAPGVRSAEEKLDRLAPRITRAASVRADLDDALDALAALEAEAGSRAVLLHLLGGLARSLPDSAFITSLSVAADGSGLVTGYAKDGVAMTAAVERVPGVARPQLDGGLAREAVGQTNWDRFGVRFRLAGARGGP